MTQYQLEKIVWTEANFEAMGWHDSFVHAFAFQPESFEFVLDLDYIFKWVKPGSDGYYSFWVSPVTLVFWNVSELSIDLEPHDGIEILDLTRESAGSPRNAEHIGRKEEWRWNLDTSVGEINLRAAGYWQYVRKYPQLQRAQVLSLTDRGGYSFERTEKLVKV